MFIGFINGVGAKECSYYMNDQLGGNNLNVVVNIDNNSAKAVIKTYKKNSGMSNNENVQNWSDIKSTYASTSECPSHIMVSKNPGYNVYLAYSEDELNSIASKKRLAIGTDAIVTTSKDNNRNDSNLNETYYKKVEDHTSYIKNVADSYDLSKCIDSEKVINRIEKCKTIYDSLNNYINSSKDEINGWIESGYIDANDSRVVNYFSTLSSVNSKWQKVKAELDKEDRKIKEELGLIDSKNNPSDGGSTFTSTTGKTACFFSKIYNLLKILVPLLVIVLSIVDFLRVLFLSDDKNYKEAYSKLIKRVIIGIVIFLVPVLISLVINLAGMGNNGLLTIFTDACK